MLSTAKSICGAGFGNTRWATECADHRAHERHWVSVHWCRQAGQTGPDLKVESLDWESVGRGRQLSRTRFAARDFVGSLASMYFQVFGSSPLPSQVVESIESGRGVKMALYR